MTLPKEIRPDDLSAMAERLRALRMTTGLSQEKFTARMGLGYSQWANFESAKGRIGIDAALTLTRKMGAPLDWIYRGEEAWLPPMLARQIEEAREKLARSPESPRARRTGASKAA